MTLTSAIGLKADILNALTNVRFWGKADMDKPLLNKLDYEYTA